MLRRQKLPNSTNRRIPWREVGYHIIFPVRLVGASDGDFIGSQANVVAGKIVHFVTVTAPSVVIIEWRLEDPVEYRLRSPNMKFVRHHQYLPPTRHVRKRRPREKCVRYRVVRRRLCVDVLRGDGMRRMPEEVRRARRRFPER